VVVGAAGLPKVEPPKLEPLEFDPPKLELPMGLDVLLAGWPIVPVFPPCIIRSASGSYTNSHSL
jgi:hypothetical protein